MLRGKGLLGWIMVSRCVTNFVILVSFLTYLSLAVWLVGILSLTAIFLSSTKSRQELPDLFRDNDRSSTGFKC